MSYDSGMIVASRQLFELVICKIPNNPNQTQRKPKSLIQTAHVNINAIDSEFVQTIYTYIQVTAQFTNISSNAQQHTDH